MSDREHKKAQFYGLQSLFSNWIYSVGAVAVLLFLGQFVDKLLFPGLVLILQFLLMRRSHTGRNRDDVVCNLLPHIMSRVLFLSAIVMVVINFYYLKIIDPQQFADGRANKMIPYITILIVAPISTIVVAWAILRRRHTYFCRTCRMIHGHYSEQGFVDRLLSNESRYQLRMLFVVSVVSTCYGWIYYAVHYINSDLNTADRFYYNWVPLILYLLSVVYMAVRYWSLFAFCQQNTISEGLPPTSATLLRYIVMCDDRILLATSEFNGHIVYDTPATRAVYETSRVDESMVRLEFDKLCGKTIEGAVFRVLYESQRRHGHGNVFHILVELPSRSVLQNSLISSGEWLTAYALGQAAKSGDLRSMLAAEIHRIYTVAMAYKAYHRTGIRRYDIRHYKPLFNLNELMVLDVDFNDPAWLLVARDNEDKPFFHLRRFWRKYVGGLEA